MFNCILFVLCDAQRGFVLFIDPVLSVLISSCFQCELDAMLYLSIASSSQQDFLEHRLCVSPSTLAVLVYISGAVKLKTVFNELKCSLEMLRNAQTVTDLCFNGKLETIGCLS